MSPLMLSIYDDSYHTFLLILERESLNLRSNFTDLDVNFQNSEGKSALFFAVEYRRERIVEHLLGRDDVDVNLQDVDGKTILWLKKIIEKNFNKIFEA